MRHIAFLIILSAFLPGLDAQELPVNDTSKNVLRLKEFSAGAIFHTQGWGFRFSRGTNVTAFRKNILEFEFVEMKNPKQIRMINQYFTNSKSYVYGKLNSLFLLRAGYGRQILLNRKPYWGGVELRFFYLGGATLGLAKPVYLYILTPTSDFYEYRITEERYDPEAHYVDNIFGRAPFTRGFDEIKMHPGLHARLGLSFDYGVYRSKVKSLEMGLHLDAFPDPVHIMAFSDPEYYFLTFFLNFNFGKRYN